MHNTAMPSHTEVKAIREKLGESQGAFGARFGVNQSTVHRWESRGLPRHGAAKMVIERLLVELGEKEKQAEPAG